MFFCLISYHKANVILSFINCSTMLKARKITVESCSMHGPGRQHHIWRWGPSGMESGNMGPMTCQEKKILRESWKLFLCTWRLILWRRDYQDLLLFSLLVSREHNQDQLNSIQQAFIDSLLYFRHWVWSSGLNGQGRHNICTHWS